MLNFVAFNPTKLHFGKGVVSDLGIAASKLGKHALLVYGGGSVKRNGSYSDTAEHLKKNHIKITEFDGIKPNPRLEDVEEGVRLGRESGVDLVVAVGGGSVIDSAKIIALCITEEYDIWKVMTGKHSPSSALPLITVLTLAATNALNNTTMYARRSGDWGVHRMGHILSYLYDTPHAATLSIIYPAWIKAMKDRAKDRIESLGQALYGISDPDLISEKLKDFFSALGSPVKCQEAGIKQSSRDEILQLLNQNKAEGLNYALSDKERENILSLCW